MTNRVDELPRQAFLMHLEYQGLVIVPQGQQLDTELTPTVFQQGIPDLRLSVVGRSADHPDVHHVAARG